MIMCINKEGDQKMQGGYTNMKGVKKTSAGAYFHGHVNNLSSCNARAYVLVQTHK